MNDDNNIVPFGQIQGGKPAEDPDAIPDNPYYFQDIEGNEFFAEGYLIFTSHHVAVMENTDNGPVVGLLLPLSRVKVCELNTPEADVEA